MSQTRAQKIRIGNTTKPNTGDVSTESTIIIYFYLQGVLIVCDIYKKAITDSYHSKKVPDNERSFVPFKH